MDTHISTPLYKIQVALLVLVLLLLLGCLRVNSRKIRKYCPAGKRLVPAGLPHHPDRCEPCPQGYFISERRHRLTQCKECWKFNPFNPVQIFVQDCTPTRNTQIRCRPGFYVGPDTTWLDCVACRDCNRFGLFEAEPCAWNEDTKCCPQKNMMIIDGACSIPPKPSTTLPCDNNENRTQTGDVICGDSRNQTSQDVSRDAASERQPMTDESRKGGKAALLLIPLAFVALTGLAAMMYLWDILFRAVQQRVG